MKRKVLTSCLCILCLIVFIFGTVPAATAVQDRYGYTLLKNDAQRSAYQSIQQGIGELQSVITFTVPGITGDDIEKAVRMMHLDYPEYFWYDGSFSWSMSSAGDVELRPQNGYSINGDAVTSANIGTYRSTLENAANAALAGLSGKSKYDKALHLHDYIAAQVTYEQTGDHQTAYGALVGKKAVCAGYARAYQYLLRLAGIESFYVTGTSRGENHGWNLVFLDGKCYYTDVTWDDQEDEIFHAYFMLSKEQLHIDHTPSDASILPSCGHGDMGYFAVKSSEGATVFSGSTTPAQIAAMCVTEKTGVYTCRIWDSTGSFESWITNQDHWVAICQALELAGQIGISRSVMGKEYHITLTGTPTTQTIPTTPTTEPRPTTPATQPTTQPTVPAPTQATEPSVAPTTVPSTGDTEPSHTETTQPETMNTVPATDNSTAVTDNTQPSDETAAGMESSTEGTDDTASHPVSPQTDEASADAVSDSDDEKPARSIVTILIAIGVLGAIAGAVVLLIRRK